MDRPARWGHARRRMRIGAPLALGTAAALGVLDACASSTFVRLETLAPPGPGIVWPRPPEQPRLRLLTTFSTPEDLGFQRSWLGRIRDFLSGESGRAGIQHPYGIAVGEDEKIYVVDSARKGVHVFELLRGRHRFISDSNFRNPVGVAVDDQKRVWVTDSEGGAILVFDGDGNRIARIHAGLVRPTGIGFQPLNGRMYVVDTATHEVVALDASGAEVLRFGGRGAAEGSFNFPTSVAVDAEGLIYVSDALNFRIQIFDEDGVPLGSFGQLGDRVGSFARPKGVGVDRAGHVFVVEGLYDVVNIFDRSGRLLLSFGGPGRGEGTFWLPTGLAVDGRDRIYVADTYNGRVQVFALLPERSP